MYNSLVRFVIEFVKSIGDFIQIPKAL